ncbi:MAG: DUF655 domain-containing protein [Candidatus Asgardarchaeia archaeon]
MSYKKQRNQRESYEEYAYILDFLPEGYFTSFQRRREPVAQAIGDSYFTLLELTPKPGVIVEVGERVYIGRGFRQKIAHVKGKISYDDLTATAKSELPRILEEIVINKESFFIEFFNRAGPLTPKLHSIELLPGVGKKTMWEILEERKKRPFESFKDLSERTSISDPVKLIVKRIEIELQDNEKYHIFVPKRKRSE